MSELLNSRLQTLMFKKNAHSHDVHASSILNSLLAMATQTKMLHVVVLSPTFGQELSKNSDHFCAFSTL